LILVIPFVHADMANAFINYRRSDAAQAAQALHAQLRARFGPTHVFFDVSAILPGAIWPDRLRSSLDTADVLLSVIGPRWLTAANQYGQRRLDDENDWVRNEICYAIENRKPIIPLLVAGADEPPPPEALPATLRGLLSHQALKLRDEKWDRDLGELTDVLKANYGFVDNQTAVPMPGPEVNVLPLNSAELEAALALLRGWQPVESMVPNDYPKPRQELRKVFHFKSFKSAVAFMSDAVPMINKIKHHPRWENQWKSVTVYLTTWDIGNQISELDLQLAKELDLLYEKSRKAIHLQ
jgi:pterin-4a-carbinolamine dehydratase